jgi:hypothetical protein
MRERLGLVGTMETRRVSRAAQRMKRVGGGPVARRRVLVPGARRDEMGLVQRTVDEKACNNCTRRVSIVVELKSIFRGLT